MKQQHELIAKAEQQQK